MCSCAENCPHSQHCIAIYIHDTGECWVACDKDDIVVPAYDQKAAKQPMDTEVDFEVKAIPLSRLAEFLSERCDGDLLVPASRLHEQVNFVAKKTPLRSAVEKIGLVLGSKHAA